MLISVTIIPPAVEPHSPHSNLARPLDRAQYADLKIVWLRPRAAAYSRGDGSEIPRQCYDWRLRGGQYHTYHIRTSRHWQQQHCVKK